MLLTFLEYVKLLEEIKNFTIIEKFKNILEKLYNIFQLALI